MNRPILKWAGGKSRVMPDLRNHLPDGDILIDPFVGGAAVFLNTNYRNYILSDINEDLIHLYQFAVEHTDVLISFGKNLFRHGSNKESYFKIRDVFNAGENGSKSDPMIWAVHFLYLNRHGYNGLCRYNLQGGYNVPFGLHKRAPYFPEKEIRLFAEKAKDTNTLFLCAPFSAAINAAIDIKTETGSTAVIYCDPPYLPESATANFSNYHSRPFGPEQHRQLVAQLMSANRDHGVPIVISGSGTPETHDVYHPFDLHSISVARSVSADRTRRTKAPEVIGVLRACEGCEEESDSDVRPGYWESEENPVPL